MKKTLEEELIPVLQQLPNFNDIVFMLDRAPTHYSEDVRNLLDEHFPGRWIGRGTEQHPAPYAWPPRSSDLTPMGFFFWRLFEKPREFLSKNLTNFLFRFMTIPTFQDWMS